MARLHRSLPPWSVPAFAAGVLLLLPARVPAAGDPADPPADPVAAAAVALSAPASAPAAAPARDDQGAAATRNGGLRFRDVAEELGVDFRYTFGDFAYDNILESSGSGATWLDADGDRDLDLYLLNGAYLDGVSDPKGRAVEGATNHLYCNDGGRFHDCTARSGLGDPRWSMAAAAADFDGDGDTDVFVAEYGPNRLYRNRGDGTFEDVAPDLGVAGPETLHGFTKWSAGATWFDADGDGDLDLMVCNFLAFDPHLLVPGRPWEMPEPAVYEGQASQLYLHEGDGFRDATEEAGLLRPDSKCMGLTVLDFDGDGRPDVFEGNDHQENFLFHALAGGGSGGAPSYEEIGLAAGVAVNDAGLPTGSMHGTPGDVDGDGRLDLLVTDLRHGSLYRRTGALLFEDATWSSGVGGLLDGLGQWGAGLRDFDLDGDLDLFTTNGVAHILVPQPPVLAVNDGTGHFRDARAGAGAYFEGRRSGRGAAFADFDDDGDVDIVVNHVDHQARVALLRNDTPRTAGRSHWVGFRVVGAHPREAFGARVEIDTGERTLVRVHQPQTSYLSGNDPRVHFGLGGLGRIPTVRVRWPSGREQTWTGLAADRYWTLEEGVDAATADAAAPAVERGGGEAYGASLNLDFETGAQGSAGGEPAGWTAGGNGYEAALDPEIAHSGARSLRIASLSGPGGEAGQGFGVATRSVPVDPARGMRLELAGYLKTDGVTGGGAGLWMRVDGPDRSILAFDNMEGRRVTGTTDWTRYAIVLPVDERAVSVYLGALLPGDGTAWVDSLSLTVLEPLPEAAPVPVRGTVRGADGTPVAGAVVVFARTPMDAEDPVRSDPDGRFDLAVPPGSYRVSVTAPGLAGAVSPLEVAPSSDSEPGAPAEPADVPLELTAGGVEISGRVHDALDEPLADATLALFTRRGGTGDLFATRTGPDGRFRVALPPSDGFTLTLSDGKAIARPELIGPDGARDLDMAVTRVGPAPQAVVDTIREHAVPLVSTEAGHGFADLEPLAGLVGDARVVALGEATHGTREFFQLKHRVFEYLAERLGFTVFAIEANQPEARAIDRYVQGGDGDPEELLAGIYFWTWDTEEVLDLIEWMRRYNADPGHRQTLHFAGFDMQTPRVAARETLAYLREVDPGLAGANEDLLDPLAGPDTWREVLQRPVGELAAMRDRLRDLVASFDGHREAWIERTGTDRFTIARQQAVVARQAVEMYAGMAEGTPQAVGLRDQAMAANVRWLLDTSPPGTRVMLWAHNGHVSRAPWANGIEPMGVHLSLRAGQRLRGARLRLRSGIVPGDRLDRGPGRARGAAGAHRRSGAAGPPGSRLRPHRPAALRPRPADSRGHAGRPLARRPPPHPIDRRGVLRRAGDVSADGAARAVRRGALRGRDHPGPTGGSDRRSSLGVRPRSRRWWASRRAGSRRSCPARPAPGARRRTGWRGPSRGARRRSVRRSRSRRRRTPWPGGRAPPRSGAAPGAPPPGRRRAPPCPSPPRPDPPCPRPRRRRCRPRAPRTPRSAPAAAGARPRAAREGSRSVAR